MARRESSLGRRGLSPFLNGTMEAVRITRMPVGVEYWRDFTGDLGRDFRITPRARGACGNQIFFTAEDAKDTEKTRSSFLCFISASSASSAVNSCLDLTWRSLALEFDGDHFERVVAQVLREMVYCRE